MKRSSRGIDMNGETPMSAELQCKSSVEFDETPVAPASTITWQQGVLELPQPFRLESGEILEAARLAWQCVGPADGPLVVALGGISAHRRVCCADGKGWWESQCGAGKTLDTRRFRVLGIDWLGGCDQSSGPGGDGGFPDISTSDQARALLALLNRLGVRRVHLLVGASYGGNVAQQLAALLGDRLRRLVLLSAAHRPAQFGLGLRHIQRAILDLGNAGPEALALARSLAVLCYRTTEGVEQRFAGQEPKCLEGQGRPREADNADGIIGWLQHHGASFSRRFDGAAYRCLGRSLDGHQIDPAAVHVRTTLFAVREDLTVPLSLLHEYAALAGTQCELVEIASPHGHDAFLKEEAAVSRILATALESCA
jgi:homoserine O-acetyltransferase/O-succinyltransferase